VDFIEGVDYAFENVEEKLYLKQLKTELEGAMYEYNTLREIEILKLHYGWDCRECTCDYIGEVLGVVGNRVRQIENMALRKLRNSKWGRLNAKAYYNQNILNIGKYDVAKVHKKMDFTEKYFKTLDKSNLLFGDVN